MPKRLVPDLSAYQVTLDDEAQDIYVIKATLGLFKLLRLHQGMKNASGIFQRTIENFLEGLVGTICFRTLYLGVRKWVERNGSNRPPVPWVESSPFRNWVEWTWVDLEKCQIQGRQHIDFDPSPFDPVRPQSIRPKLFDQKGRPNSFRPISFDPFHAIRCILTQFMSGCPAKDETIKIVRRTQLISMALQIGNAACVLGTVSDRDAFEETFYT